MPVAVKGGKLQWKRRRNKNKGRKPAKKLPRARLCKSNK